MPEHQWLVVSQHVAAVVDLDLEAFSHRREPRSVDLNPLPVVVGGVAGDATQERIEDHVDHEGGPDHNQGGFGIVKWHFSDDHSHCCVGGVMAAAQTAVARTRVSVAHIQDDSSSLAREDLAVEHSMVVGFLGGLGAGNQILDQIVLAVPAELRLLPGLQSTSPSEPTVLFPYPALFP